MNENTSPDNVPETVETSTERRPNEQAGFYFSGYFRITDPQSGQVLVQSRID